MIRTLSFVSFVLCAPVLVHADEAQDIANMGKAEFLSLAEDLTLQGLGAQAEMIRRFKADAVPDSMTAPLSEAERTAMACSWDKLNEGGLLEEYAKQVLLIRQMISLVEDDPKFDIVDLFGNQDLLLEMGESVSDEVATAMNDCGTIEATQPRTAFMFDLFPLMATEMKARGYEF